jgi:hypothetical protein
MKLRPYIWTLGLAYVGYVLSAKLPMARPTAEIVGTVAGGVVGFGVGWGLQRLLELGRRH